MDGTQPSLTPLTPPHESLYPPGIHTDNEYDPRYRQHLRQQSLASHVAVQKTVLPHLFSFPGRVSDPCFCVLQLQVATCPPLKF